MVAELITLATKNHCRNEIQELSEQIANLKWQGAIIVGEKMSCYLDLEGAPLVTSK